MNSKVIPKLSTKWRQLGEAISSYCFPNFILGKAIASPRLYGALPMREIAVQFENVLVKIACFISSAV
jgi:hypothetical protein